MALKWLLNAAIFTQVNGGIMDSTTNLAVQKWPNGEGQVLIPNGIMLRKEEYPNGFRVPLHYPKYSKADYEKMEEWRLDVLLQQYGLCFEGTLDHKRAFAIGAFLWPTQI